MKFEGTFWNSAILYFLGQIWKVLDEYNKQMENINCYSSSQIDYVLRELENYEVITSICYATDCIFQFIIYEMPRYIYDNAGNKSYTKPDCMDKLKEFVNTFEQKRR